jgi:signal transduction histidine kinase
VTLSTAYFQRFYAGVTDPAGAPVVALLRSDGVFLLRFPAPKPVTVTRVTNPAVVAALAGDAPPVFRARSPQDGRQRLVALRPLRGVPMAVVYACSDAGSLTVWYRHLADLTVLAVLVSGVLGLATRLAMLRARGERASLQRLLAETERREQAEAALRQSQKMEALGRLTGGVAHDFNNLLTAVMGSLEIAIRRSSDPGVRRLLEGAMDAARRGARLTRQMLAFSRQQQPVMQAVPVRAMIEAAQDLLRRTLGPDITIHQDLPADLWWAHAEPTQLEVGLLNLAINARDAMPGGGELRFMAENLPATAPRPAAVPDGEFVVIRVADTGAGMPEAVRLRAAEPFFTTKEVGRGTGLGLSTVDGLARQSGGAMTIDSAPGCGTTISLYLPRAMPKAVAASESDAKALHGRRLTVLVVDDDAAVRRTTTAMLQELGHAVVEAADGPEALGMAEITALDLAVVDFAMPVMDGGALAAALVEFRPGLRGVGQFRRVAGQAVQPGRDRPRGTGGHPHHSALGPAGGLTGVARRRGKTAGRWVMRWYRGDQAYAVETIDSGDGRLLAQVSIRSRVEGRAVQVEGGLGADMLHPPLALRAQAVEAQAVRLGGDSAIRRTRSVAHCAGSTSHSNTEFCTRWPWSRQAGQHRGQLLHQVRRQAGAAEESIKICGAFTPRRLGWPPPRCRWPTPDTIAGTAAGACRRGFAFGSAAAGARRAWSTASADAWQSACSRGDGRIGGHANPADRLGRPLQP